jgi:hypothetical protein
VRSPNRKVCEKSRKEQRARRTLITLGVFATSGPFIGRCGRTRRSASGLDILQRFSEELKKNSLGFTPEAADLIVHYSWPGKIRELKNVVERTMFSLRKGTSTQFPCRRGSASPGMRTRSTVRQAIAIREGISSSACGNWKRITSAKCWRLLGTTRLRRPKFSASILRRYCAD